MLKKEFRDIVVPTLARLAVLGVIPILAVAGAPLSMGFRLIFVRGFHFFTRSPENLLPVSLVLLLGILIFLAANFLGAKAFRCEHRDRAFEYLFALPLSRWQILRCKLLPRLAVLAVLTLIYEVLAFTVISPLRPIRGGLFFLIDPLFFPFWVIYIFLVGFFLSLFEQKNWIAVVLLSLFPATVLVSLAFRTMLESSRSVPVALRYLSGIAFGLGTWVVMAVLAAAFLLVYRKFTLKSPRLIARRFALLSLPPLAILIFASLILLLA